MTQPPKNIPPDVEAKWLELRQKHLEDSNRFQRDAARKRAEFESRVEKGRKGIPEKHMKEESEFWSKHTKASGAARGATKSVRTQPPVSARASTVASRKPPTPAAGSLSSRPAVPRLEVDPPATPSRALQTAKLLQVPTAPKEQPRRPPQKSGKSEVIDLCSSDDEQQALSKKTPVPPKAVAPCPVQQPSIAQETVAQEPVSPEQVHSSTGFAIPEATLELFGRSAPHRTSASIAPRVKTEKDQSGHPELTRPLRSPSMPHQPEVHGLPRSAPGTSSSQRAPTATPHFGHPAHSRPFTPPSNPGYGPWHAASLNISSPGCLRRAAPAMPESLQPCMSNGFASSNSHHQTGGFGFGRNNAVGGFWQRAAPSLPKFAFPSRSTSQFASALTQNSGQERSLKPPFDSPDQQQHDRPAASYHSYGGSQSPEPLLFAQQTVDGSIVNNALRTEYRDAFEQNGRNVTEGDVEMANDLSHTDTSMSAASHSNSSHTNCTVSMTDNGTATTKVNTSAGNDCSPSYHQQNTMQKSPSAAPFKEPPNPLQQTRMQHLPSPPPSHASVVSEPTTPGTSQLSTPVSSFKRPSLPASADPSKSGRQLVDPEVRHIRAGTVDSRASSVTLPTDPRTQRGASTTSRASRISALTEVSPKRKRKVTIDLSSDEEDVSDYAPSEPDSPLTGKSDKVLQSLKFKRIKALDGSESASKIPSRIDKTVHKSNYGFKSMTIPKPGSKSTSATTTSAFRKTSTPAAFTTSTKPSVSRSTTATRDQPSFARAGPTHPSTATTQAKPKAAPVAKKTQQMKFIPSPSKRRAALASEDKTRGIYQDLEEFTTECAVEDADQLEDARLPEDMRRMSITPAPQVVGEETVDVLSTPATENNNDRTNGDRHRYQATVIDDESEPDISEYMYINGIIVRKGDV